MSKKMDIIKVRWRDHSLLTLTGDANDSEINWREIADGGENESVGFLVYEDEDYVVLRSTIIDAGINAAANQVLVLLRCSIISREKLR